MALAKPEVKPTSPAVFGDDWFFIHFFYKQDLSKKQAEIKLFDINNVLIKPEDPSEWLFFLQFNKIEDKDNLYSALFDWDGANLLTEGQFYKASLRIVDTVSGEKSPWSNLTIFKQTSKPTVTRLPWLDAPEETFFLNDTLFYTLADDRTEVLEKVEYQYLVELSNSLENFVPDLELPKEEIPILELYDDNFEYKIELKSIFDYSVFRERLLTLVGGDWVKVGVLAKFYTKNGIFIWETEDVERIQLDSKTQTQVSSPYIIEPKSEYARIILSSDHQPQFQATRYKVYNQDLLIGDFLLQTEIISDISSNYLNHYQVFGIGSASLTTEQVWVLYYYIYDPIVCDFDSVFLVDAKEDIQLNITLNNSVNSFKYNILETKTDTIGSQYPIFFRNPNARYREFSLSGTISYHSLVSFGKECGIDFSLPETPHTNLTTDNLYAERIFREKVIDFLTKDRPLLYKSQTEGNIVVKLMNIQLTPNKTLGRMIYDFSCTCYEVQDLQSYMKERWE